MKSKLIKFSTAGAGLLASANVALAQGSLTSIDIGDPGGGVRDLSVLITSAFNLAIAIAIIFVFGMLIMGGYGWLTAGGDKGKVEEARTRITNAIIGLAIVASAWVLVNLVANFFGVSLNDINIPDATGGGSGGTTDPGVTT